jgi:type III secretory pathway lipoprotein EscJ
MIPVVAKFATEADADKMIAVLTKAGAANIIKTRDDDGGFTVTFDEPDDDEQA